MKVTRKQLVQLTVGAAVFLLIILYSAQLWAGLKALLATATPLVIGAALAYCMNLIVVRLERVLWPHAQGLGRRLRRPVAIVSAIVLTVVILAGVLRLVVPQFVAAVDGFFTSLPQTLTKLNDWLTKSDQATALTKKLASADIDWSSLQQKATRYLSAGVSGLFSGSLSLVSSVAGGVVNFILAFTFAIYLVAGKEGIGSRLNRVGDAFLPAKFMAKLRYVLHEADLMFSRFIVGQVTEAFILGTLCTLGMLLFRFPNAGSIGAFIGMTALIPMLGAYIGGAIGFVLIVVVSPLKAVLFLVYLVCLQQLEGNLIYPRVVGGSIGLPGILVLAAVTVGSGIGGVLGMLLGVPLAATAYRLIRNATWRKEGRPLSE